jgi:hypothetical protein
MVWEMVDRDNGTLDRRLQFPIAATKIEFEASCEKINTPSQWVKDAIKITQAFPGGRSASLCDLNGLNNADKHRFVTSVLRASKRPPYSVIDERGVILHTVGWGEVLGFDEAGTELARVGHGLNIQIENDAECMPQIYLEKPNHRLEEASSMLNRLLGRTRDAVAAVERRTPR